MKLHILILDMAMHIYSKHINSVIMKLILFCDFFPILPISAKRLRVLVFIKSGIENRNNYTGIVKLLKSKIHLVFYNILLGTDKRRSSNLKMSAPPLHSAFKV